MATDDDLNHILNSHPIFQRPSPQTRPSFRPGASVAASYELSANTLSRFTSADPENDDPTPSGRRQAMVINDTELIVAVGSELRVMTLGEVKLNNKASRSYKVSPSSLQGPRMWCTQDPYIYILSTVLFSGSAHTELTV